MTEKYILLKAKMIENGVTESQLSKHFGKSKFYFSQKINEMHPWKLSDVYDLCDFLQIPYDEIHVYFPK